MVFDHFVDEGDEVLSTDPEAGTTGPEKVVDLHVNRDRDLTDLTVVTDDGERSRLHTTQRHPFWSASRSEWVDAADLVPGEVLHAADGTTVTVSRVRSFTGVRTMRDLTVDRVHTYYVMADQAPVLVHNCPGGFLGRFFGSKPSKLDAMDQEFRSKTVSTRLGDLSHVETPDYGIPASKVSDVRNMSNDVLLRAINDPSEKVSTVRIYNGVVEEGNHRMREALNRMANPGNDVFTENTRVNVINEND